MPVKTIMVDETTHDRLKSYQLKGETKEQTLNRLFDEIEDSRDTKCFGGKT